MFMFDRWVDYEQCSSMNSEKTSKSSRRPHAELKKAALAAGELIVVEEGLGALTARRVAAETGCSVGTLYNVFGHLDGLIAEINLSTFRQMAEEASRTVRSMPEDARREARLAALARMYLHFARTHRNRWSAVFEHRPQGPTDQRIQTAEQLLFSRIIAAAGIEPSAANPAEADSLRMLLAAVHGVVTFAINRTIPIADAERYVTLIVQAGVRGYREMVEEGLM